MHKKFLASDKELLMDADIVTCSYMPDDQLLAEQRFIMLINQQIRLKEQFPKLTRLIYGSNWDEARKRRLATALGHRDHNAIFKKKQVHKAEIHNRVMKAIKPYGKTLSKAVLILGDDVVPVKMDIGEDPVKMLKHWIKYPYEMPAPCLFFSCKGTLRDTYYKERMKKGVRFSPTAAVTDWAILIRNDFQVIMGEDEIVMRPTDDIDNGKTIRNFQFNSDAMLRFKAASLGYEVLKDQELFFETFQSTSSDKNSVWYASREARREGVELTNLAVRYRWPWLFEGKQPVWQIKGAKLQKYLNLGWLMRGNYSYIPNPASLQSRFERKKVNKNSLSDLL